MASSSTDRPYPTLAEIHQRFGKPLTPTSSGSSSSSSSSPPIHQRHLDDTIISSQTRASIASRTPPRGRSSVLVGLFTHPRTGLIHVVLTQRAADLRSHAGDVALPGGKRDSTDVNDIDCALRESFEEIGLPRSSGDLHVRAEGSGVRVITTGKSSISKHGLEVIPIIAQIPVPDFIAKREKSNSSALSPMSPSLPVDDTFTLHLNSSEVSVLFTLPLHHFLESGPGYKYRDIDWMGTRVRMHEFNVTLPPEEWIDSKDVATSSTSASPRSFRIWGLTSYMLVSTAIALFQRQPQFDIRAAMVHKRADSPTIDNTDSKL